MLGRYLLDYALELFKANQADNAVLAFAKILNKLGFLSDGKLLAYLRLGSSH